MEVLVKRSLIKKGAEANLYLGSFIDVDVVIKERIPKRYRSPEMDFFVRRYRTLHEAKLLSSARQVGVPTPFVYLVDEERTLLVMDYIQGTLLKMLLTSANEARRDLSFKVGVLIGRLHANGIVHGDLTTSNMILGQDKLIYFIDFGLGEFTSELEAQGVDLHLMFRALESFHYQVYKDCFQHIIDGYESIVGRDVASKVLKRVEEIRRRGRYVTKRNLP